MPELQYCTIAFFRNLEQQLIYTHSMMEQFMSFLVPSDGVSTHLRQVPKTQLGEGSIFTVLIDLNDDSVFVKQSEDTVYLEDKHDDDDHRRLDLSIKVLLLSIDNTISLFVSSFPPLCEFCDRNSFQSVPEYKSIANLDRWSGTTVNMHIDLKVKYSILFLNVFLVYMYFDYIIIKLKLF
jgi:hypothetical protein